MVKFCWANCIVGGSLIIYYNRSSGGWSTVDRLREVTIQDSFFPLTIRLPNKLASLSFLIWNHHRICQIIIIDHFPGLVVARLLFLPAFCHHPFF